MRIAPIYNSIPIQYAFKGTLDDSVKNHINKTAKTEEHKVVAKSTIEELENYMQKLHPNTVLRKKARPQDQVEMYNSLLDITIPFTRKSSMLKRGDVKIRIPDPYPYYLSKRSVMSCRQFSEGLNKISPDDVDALFVYEALKQLEINAKASSRSAKAWYKTNKLMDLIIEYQKNANIDKRITREQLREIVKNA